MVKSELQVVKSEVPELREELQVVKSEVPELRSQLGQLQNEVKTCNKFSLNSH